MDKGYQITDLLNGEDFQKLQDTFAKAFDLGFITVDYMGRPVFKYSGFTQFCNKLRKKTKCLELCKQCDAHGGIHATITGEPYIYICHAGLVDFAIPLIVEGKYMGALMGGQALIDGPAPELEPIIPQKYNWQDDPELVEASKHVNIVTYDKLVAKVYLVRDMIQNLMKEKLRELAASELKKKDIELREEKALRISLEETIEENSTKAYLSGSYHDFIFFTLNILSRLAYKEKAAMTEQTVYDVAKIIRYSNENNRDDFVTLGEEIECIRRYLNIQKMRLQDRLSFDITVPEEFYAVLCPLMVLLPFVENAIVHAVEKMSSQGKISIEGHIEKNNLLISITDNGEGISRKQINGLLELEGHKPGRRSTINRLNKQIKDIVDRSCGVSILSREDGFAGTKVTIMLPCNFGGGSSAGGASDTK